MSDPMRHPGSAPPHSASHSTSTQQVNLSFVLPRPVQSTFQQK